ncbi:MAG: DegT/DnrJ/EryC1/StrS family aminotransferase [Candidatus Omnitrophica bacterium]|nr:DegT/DnrJ/EryC1/StrS family aminotransferase [Candidatus Omnitrophota bacterium]
MKVSFLNLVKQHKQIEGDLEKAVQKVMRGSHFILGDEVRFFEAEFAAYCKTKFAVGLNSGTDALFLSLLALGIGSQDEVIVPVFTFIATANAVTYTGAKPVFVDIDEKTYNIDPRKIEKAITKKTKAIIPVHLFGQSADMDPIMRIAKKHGLKVIEDACQAHGAEYKSHVITQKRIPTPPIASGASHTSHVKVGSIGNAGCFSFYPTKNLGGFGDGGMVVTNEEKVYKKLLLLRDCGRRSRYEHVVVGYNSRLDSIQAAGLRVKLKYLDCWNKMRRYNAGLYDKFLEKAEGVVRPFAADYAEHVYHIYALRLKKRDKVIDRLKSAGVGVMINYPLPLHLQKAYSCLGYGWNDFPVAEQICREIISLPMHPLLTKNEIKYVSGALIKSTEE